MQFSVFPLLYVLLVLSLLFTVGCGAALLLRKSAAAPGGSGTRILWIGILLLSVLPLHILRPTTDVTIYETPETVTVRFTEIPLSAEDSTADAEAVPDVSLPDVSPTAPDVPAPAYDRSFRLTASAAAWVQAICYGMAGLWIVGATASLLLRLTRRISLKRKLCRHASPCGDTRVLALYRDAARRAGLRRLPPLLLFDAGIVLSPCVCGAIRPTVFLSRSQAEMADDALSLVLTHELCHVRRGDEWLFLLWGAVSAVHFYHPLKKAAETALIEDIELSCDAEVLRLHGTDARLPYIRAILDIASAISDHGAKSGSFCAARPTSADFMKRRYDMMKKTKTRRLSRVLSLLLAAVLIGCNALAMSACDVPTVKANDLNGDAPDTPVTLQSPLLATAISEYFGLADPKELTGEHLALITSLEILETDYPQMENPPYLGADGTEYTPVRIRINGGTVYAGGTFYTLPTQSSTYAVTNEYDIQTLPEMMTAEQMEALLSAIEQLEAEGNKDFGYWAVTKVKSFYTVIKLDENHPEYPFLRDRSAVVIDSSLNPREVYMLTQYVLLTSFADSRAVREATVDLADLALLPNLTKVTLSERFTAVNVPDGISVTPVPLTAPAE